MRTRKHNRLRDYDYRTPGAYFITTVVRDRRNTFGEVKDGENHLTAYGETLVEQWHWLHKQYLHITLDQFVVMPNHFHGIVIVGTGRDLSLQPKTKSLSELVGAFKTTSSKRIHQLGCHRFNGRDHFTNESFAMMMNLAAFVSTSRPTRYGGRSTSKTATVGWTWTVEVVPHKIATFKTITTVSFSGRDRSRPVPTQRADATVFSVSSSSQRSILKRRA